MRQVPSIILAEFCLIDVILMLTDLFLKLADLTLVVADLIPMLTDLYSMSVDLIQMLTDLFPLLFKFIQMFTLVHVSLISLQRYPISFLCYTPPVQLRVA